MLKAVVFDMDGVLIDSEPLWAEAEKTVFARYDLLLDDHDCEATRGLRIDQAVSYWQQRYPAQLSQSTEILVTDVLAELQAAIEQRGRALPGVDHLLGRLNKQKIPMAIASSSPPEVIAQVVAKLNIGHFFTTQLSAMSIQYGKPHPAVYLQACNTLQTPAQNCLAIEDSINGMIAAKSARMPTLVVPEAAQFTDQRWSLADKKLASLAQFTQQEWDKLCQ